MAAEEEEALKRNTDCVYFLASPLTCKKGSECEYRHSDIARVNPTDCWYWLNANCLNPNCAFRHPPLDGLMETQMPTSTGSAVAQPQGVPCKFFQGGFCLKGHWCPFLHAPNSVKNKAYAASITEPLNADKVETPVLEKKVPPTNKGEVKPIKQVAGEVKPDVPINELSRSKRMRDTSCMEELPDYNSHLVSNGSMVSPFISVQQPHLVVESSMINNKDGDVSREHSPGFDVLVDDEGRGSDFYHNEDQYGMPREYTAINRYEIDHLSDYSMSGEADDWYREVQGYPKGQYGFERNEASPERMSAGFYHKRRLCARDELDLRHHLTRNKKPHGLKSIIITKRNDDHSCEGLNFPSNRLRGRIRLPPRSSSPIDRRDDNGRLSSVRACLPSNHRCIKKRVKARVEEASSDGLKNHSGWHSIRDMNGDNNADFAGPKSLAELKNRKNAEPSRDEVMDQQQLGKRKQSEHDALQQNVDVFSFEGPKPLEEILKKKRGETNEMVNCRDSSASLKNESSYCDGKKEAILFATIERNGAEESGYSHYVASKACEQKKEFNSDVDSGVGFDMCCGEGNTLMMMATATRL